MTATSFSFYFFLLNYVFVYNVIPLEVLQISLTDYKLSRCNHKFINNHNNTVNQCSLTLQSVYCSWDKANHKFTNDNEMGAGARVAMRHHDSRLNTPLTCSSIAFSRNKILSHQLIFSQFALFSRLD